MRRGPLPGLRWQLPPQFVVSYLEAKSLGLKPTPKDPSALASARDAFEAIEPALLVTSTAGHHVVLNKFPIVPGHLVLTTREFEAQDSPLTPSDIEITWKW